MSENQEDMIEVEEDTQRNRFLAFSIGKESYGIEIQYVTEIIGLQSITEIPEFPPYIKGVINLRGQIIPVMDVRLRFKKESSDYNDRTCVIVVEIQSVSMGLIVDRVSEVLTIPEGDIIKPPKISKEFQNQYIKNIGKVKQDIKLLLDCEKLVTEEEIRSIEECI